MIKLSMMSQIHTCAIFMLYGISELYKVMITVLVLDFAIFFCLLSDDESHYIITQGRVSDLTLHELLFLFFS